MVSMSNSEYVNQAAWVVEGLLAKSQRPGYPVDKPPLQTIQEWAEEVTRMGIRGVVCILDRPQIAHYDHLNLDGGGLFGFYRTLGLTVEHILADDHKMPPLSDSQLDAVWGAYERLEKPVLVHCSAGRHRTGAAVEHILWQLQEDFPSEE